MRALPSTRREITAFSVVFRFVWKLETLLLISWRRQFEIYTTHKAKFSEVCNLGKKKKAFLRILPAGWGDLRSRGRAAVTGPSGGPVIAGRSLVVAAVAAAVAGYRERRPAARWCHTGDGGGVHADRGGDLGDGGHTANRKRLLNLIFTAVPREYAKNRNLSRYYWKKRKNPNETHTCGTARKTRTRRGYEQRRQRRQRWPRRDDWRYSTGPSLGERARRRTRVRCPVATAAATETTSASLTVALACPRLSRPPRVYFGGRAAAVHVIFGGRAAAVRMIFGARLRRRVFVRVPGPAVTPARRNDRTFHGVFRRTFRRGLKRNWFFFSLFRQDKTRRS